MHSALVDLQGTIVMQAYEFQHDGRVTHWEFESIKTGNVKLQVMNFEFKQFNTRPCPPSSPHTTRLPVLALIALIHFALMKG